MSNLIAKEYKCFEEIKHTKEGSCLMSKVIYFFVFNIT